MTIEQIRQLLLASTGRLREIERGSGVGYHVIRSIRDGHTKHPRIDNFSKLAKYFGERDLPVE